MRNLFFIVALVFIVAGCGPIHTGPRIDHTKLNQIVEGKTTKGEVLALFGNRPTTQTRDSSGLTTLTWVHTRHDYNYMIGIHLPAASDVVTVVFDKRDIVRHYSYGGFQGTQEVWHEPSGKGGQPPDLGVRQQTFPQ